MSKFFRTFTFFLILILSGFLQSHAQPKDIFDKVQFDNSSYGQIRIVQSDSIARLINLHLWEESKVNGIRGYRIRIYRGTGQSAAKELEEARAKFLRVCDDISDHTDFDPPYYLFEVGDFRTYSEALNLLKSIEKYFPNQLYIIKTKINYPKL